MDEGASPGSEPFEPDGVDWVPVSPRLATARLVVGVPVLLVPAVAGAVGAVVGGWAWLWLVPVAAVAAAAWLWWLVGRQVRALGYAERAEDLLVRRGIMWRQLVVVPYGRLQFVEVQAGPVDRALGIARVQLHTASAGTDAVVPGLRPQDAALLRDRLSARGQARLAGL